MILVFPVAVIALILSGGWAGPGDAFGDGC